MPFVCWSIPHKPLAKYVSTVASIIYPISIGSSESERAVLQKNLETITTKKES
jgi:hypothetical protein